MKSYNHARDVSTNRRGYTQLPLSQKKLKETDSVQNQGYMNWERYIQLHTTPNTEDPVGWAGAVAGVTHRQPQWSREAQG